MMQVWLLHDLAHTSPVPGSPILLDYSIPFLLGGLLILGTESNGI